MKKKALVILLVAIIISVFFCVPANASILYGSYATDTDQQGNIIMSTTVHEMEDNTSSQHRSLLLVTVQLENISSLPTYIAYARLTIYFNDVDVYWGDLDTYSNDAYLTRRYDGQYSSFQVVPNNDFSYNDGIIVPPNSSIYAIGVIGVHNSAYSDQITGFTVQNSIGTVASSDNYPYGTVVNYSPLITTLNGLFQTEHTDLNNILIILGFLKVDTGNITTDVDDINSKLSNVINLLTYTGSSPGITAPGYSIDTSVFNGPPQITFRRTVYTGYPVTYDFELDNSSDQAIQNGYYCQPVLLQINFSSNTKSFYTNQIYFNVTSVLPTGLRTELVDYYSDMFDISFIQSNVLLTYRQQDGIYRGIVPKGYNNTLILLNVYSDISNPAVFPTFDISNISTIFTEYTGYAPRNILEAFKDYFVAWKGNSTTNNNISSDSGTLKTESDAIHQQEQTYYTQNQQAIEATGLRNYNFSQSQGDGIARVSLDFTNLWNSLGSFNSVYIFSLTLGLALTILRHAPNAISRIRWKKNQ